jgi:hypothetical protein
MTVSDITFNRESHEIKLYFKEHNYDVTTAVTHITWRMYCEFNNIKMVEERELVIAEHKRILSNLDFNELMSL